MKTSFVLDDTKPLASLEALVMRHGAVVIGLAYLRATLARRLKAREARDPWISDHMRRDIGLGPKVDPSRRHDRLRYGGIE
jgi:hypothetical protein